MRKLLLALGLLLGSALAAQAQVVPCIGVGGVNTVPQTGVSCASEPMLPTYAATSVALVPVAAGATDFFCIAGAASKVVRIQKIRVSGTATTIVSVPLLVMKHVSLDTGAASATTTMIPVPYALDPSAPSPSATTRAWITSNPTITDATPGIIEGANLQLNLPAAVSKDTLFDWRERNFMQAPILRTAAQEVCLNLNTTAVVAGLLYTTIEWTEAAQ
jgi:hypothetical protein